MQILVHKQTLILLNHHHSIVATALDEHQPKVQGITLDNVDLHRVGRLSPINTT